MLPNIAIVVLAVASNVLLFFALVHTRDVALPETSPDPLAAPLRAAVSFENARVPSDILWRTIRSTHSMGTAQMNLPSWQSVCQNGTAADLQYFLQTFFGEAKVFTSYTYVYFTYKVQINASASAWGSCGCDNTTCWFFVTNGTHYDINGTNPNAVTNTALDSNCAGEGWCDEIAAMNTSASPNGMWLTPYGYFEALTGVNYLLQTYSIPLVFDSSGNCILAMSIDLNLAEIQQALFYATPTLGATSVAIALPSMTVIATSPPMQYSPTIGMSQFVQPSGLQNTVARNAVQAVLNRYGTLNVDADFQAGDQYVTTLTSHDGRYALVDSYPAAPFSPMCTAYDPFAKGFRVLSLQTAGSHAIESLLNVITGVQALQAIIATNTAALCKQGTTLALQNFLAPFYGKTQAFKNYSYAYLVYSVMVGGTPMWGSCGCSNNGDCYSFDENATYRYYNTPTISTATPTNATANFTCIGQQWCDVTSRLTSANASGVFYPPEYYVEPGTNESESLTSFVVPLSYNSSGNCVVAIAIDIGSEAFQRGLEFLTPPGFSALVAEVQTGTILAQVPPPPTSGPVLPTISALTNPALSTATSAVMTTFGRLAIQADFPTQGLYVTTAPIVFNDYSQAQWTVLLVSPDTAFVSAPNPPKWYAYVFGIFALLAILAIAGLASQLQPASAARASADKQIPLNDVGDV